MSARVGFGKRSKLVEDLAGQIRSGRLPTGARLPGENRLAELYQVSRGTVRSALSELQQRALITTQTGVGSFVTFDGVHLDQGVGWARALAESGFTLTTELISITTVRDQELSEQFEVDSFVAVLRRRRAENGHPVSLERSLLPGDGPLADLPERGLVDDSLTATLTAAGLRGVSGEQWITTRALDDQAELLERGPEEQFLQAVRITLSATGTLVEHVTSLLDPARFRFHLRFGPQ
ncbi:GntR family transcriptional regulator [Amycolatopsis sp. NPDC059027]|uniref:GntR family transcriptional regulator n=1 Tax=Amycolatopsis sp. NPDC059027 TaxID=3346709 RepID=UPI003671D3CB